MSAKLFGSSGIRGLANVEVTPLLALRVGAALSSQLDGGVVAVGRDTRLTGEMLEAAVVAGLASCGADVKALGVTPTPVLAYLTRELGAGAGVAVSASHNPPEYNGLKIFDSTSMAYTKEKQRAIEERISRDDFNFRAYDKIGAIEKAEANRRYIDAIADGIRLKRKWRIACDLFNGATSVIIPILFRKLGCDATLIDAQPDGHFPSGNPEPTPEALQRLAKVVCSRRAEIGFGFDGDGDRMMALDDAGRVPTPDRVLAAYARHVVETERGGVVVTHVGASMCIEEAVHASGGSVIRTRVGDVSVIEAMKMNGALFGGEPVGAWIHPKVHLCPDGVLSALKLMEALEEEEKTLSEFIADIPEYPLLNAKVECLNQLKQKTAEDISERYKEVFDDAISVSTVDGLRLELGNGWTLIRPSGTEPLIRITAEAKDMKSAKEILERSRRLVQKAMEGRPRRR